MLWLILQLIPLAFALSQNKKKMQDCVSEIHKLSIYNGPKHLVKDTLYQKSK